MLTLGFWLFAIALAAIFFNNTSWLLLPIFVIAFTFAIKKDKEWEKKEKTAKEPIRRYPEKDSSQKQRRLPLCHHQQANRNYL